MFELLFKSTYFLISEFAKDEFTFKMGMNYLDRISFLYKNNEIHEADSLLKELSNQCINQIDLEEQEKDIFKHTFE